MEGFGNIAVHDYRLLSLDGVRIIVADHLDDFLRFARVAMKS